MIKPICVEPKIADTTHWQVLILKTNSNKQKYLLYRKERKVKKHTQRRKRNRKDTLTNIIPTTNSGKQSRNATPS
jgi:hypothetical protein